MQPNFKLIKLKKYSEPPLLNLCVMKVLPLDNNEKKCLLNSFFEELENIQPLQTDEKEKMIDLLTIIETDKHTTVLPEGEICKYLWVVIRGLVRSYYYVGDTEVTSSLMKPHHIIISIESFHTQTPAYENLETLQPSMLACMHYQQLENLYQQFPSLNYIGRRLTEQYLFLTEKRMYMLRKQKASDRYKFFLKQYPGLANEVPLKYIASFLGINGETLSRVRNKIR